MVKEKITKKEAIKQLKALGMSENEAIGTIDIRLSLVRVIRQRQATDAIINMIGDDE